MTPKNRRPKTVEEYLAGVPPRARAALKKLRRDIRAAAPEATEGLGWGMPAFRQRVWLVSYAAFRDHCSFFPMSANVIRRHADLLKGYETTKGTIHFAANKPLPTALVKRLVRARLVEVNTGPASRRGGS